jgi:two-component system, NtrC family, sensor kinase
MRIRLTMTVAALLLAAMLLINLVLLLLWQRDAMQREAARDQAVLACIQYRLETENASLKTVSTLFSFAEFYLDSQEGQLVLLLEDDMQQIGQFPPLLATALRQAAAGQAVSHSSSPLAALLRGQPLLLATARPLLRQGRIIGAAAVFRPLASVAQALWRAEKIVLLYVLFNLLVLGLISFFRLNSLIVRPIEQLAELAGQHSSHEAVWFAADDSGSELQRLSGSLNKMMKRIETDRKTLQQMVAELEFANQQLHERQAEMLRTERLAAAGRLAAGLAHEIGNPLAVIQGYLDLLACTCQNEESSDFIRRADQELQRVNRLIRQLLDSTRASKGRPEVFSLHPLLFAVVDMVQVQKAFKAITVTVCAAAAADMVHADPDQLRQVLLNCLLNSADAINSTGRPDGTITMTTDRPEPNLLRLRIADNGSGITEEELASVFDPFYTTKEPGQGTGLGLSVSRSIIEAAGGVMNIASRAGQGTEVAICLPSAEKNKGEDNGRGAEAGSGD